MLQSGTREVGIVVQVDLNAINRIALPYLHLSVETHNEDADEDRPSFYLSFCLWQSYDFT